MLREYVELYLNCDIILLADCFGKVCETYLRTYELDPAHNYTARGLAFDAMLNITKVKLEFLPDIDMILFIESGIWGDITKC